MRVPHIQQQDSGVRGATGCVRSTQVDRQAPDITVHARVNKVGGAGVHADELRIIVNMHVDTDAVSGLAMQL